MIQSGTLDFLHARCGWLVGELKIREGLKYSRDDQIGWLVDQMKECVSMGHAIAMDEVRSTPWEYLCQGILDSATDNEKHMDDYAAQGWELQFVSSGWMFWRRRKAVGEAEGRKA